MTIDHRDRYDFYRDSMWTMREGQDAKQRLGAIRRHLGGGSLTKKSLNQQSWSDIA